MLKDWKSGLLGGVALLGITLLPCHADPIVTPNLGLSIFSLGTMPGTNGTVYGGLGFNNGNLLLAAYSPPLETENIYSAPVIRDSSGQISGFGTVTSFSVDLTNDNTIGNSVAGGLAFLPNGTFLYTTAAENYIGQYANGVSNLTTITDPNNPSALLGGLGYLPGPGNSTQLVASFTNGDWFQVTATQQGSGPFYNIQLGAAFISGLPANAFSFDSQLSNVVGGGVLVGDVASATLTLYGLNSNGVPLQSTGITVANGFTEGIGYGVAVDPVTGGVIITGSNGDLWEIMGPYSAVNTPEPATVTAAFAAIGAMFVLRRRRVL